VSLNTRTRYKWFLAALVVAAAIWFLFRPVCVPLSPDSLQNFTTPIEERTDHDFYLRIFQQRDGQWYQCKTWISRQFFF
jgi:hypothetical protein